MAKPKLLFIDDDIVTHDPGDFPEDAGTCDDVEVAPGTVLGLMGYYVMEFEKAGFEVLFVKGVEEALEVIKDNSLVLGAVVLDVMMPFLEQREYDEEATAGGLRTGFVLAEEIHRLRPDLPIWILSQVVPTKTTAVNEGTVDDLLQRGVVKGVVCKLDLERNVVDFAKTIKDEIS